MCSTFLVKSSHMTGWENEAAVMTSLAALHAQVVWIG